MYLLMYLSLLIHSCQNLVGDKDCYNSNINPLLIFAEEASKPSKRKVDTSEEYLKWKFSKLEGKKGVYFEYKPVSTEVTLVIP